MLVAPGPYSELLAGVAKVLGPNRSPICIGFDGRDGSGKTSAASWLAWQIGASSIHFDMFSRPLTVAGPVTWFVDQIRACIDSRTRRHKPVIVESVLLLDAMEIIGVKVDYLVFVEHIEPPKTRERPLEDDELHDPREHSLSNQIDRYLRRRHLPARADFKLVW
jgi:hypothetical protein